MRVQCWGYKSKYTVGMIPKNGPKHVRQRLEDVRCSAIGDTVAIVWLARMLTVKPVAARPTVAARSGICFVLLAASLRIRDAL